LGRPTVVVLKVCWLVYVFLTSLYCLLAYVPYTFFFAVKEPPYEWITWFAHHHATLYWPALACAAAAYWPRSARPPDIRIYRGLFCIFTAAGLYITVHPLLSHLQNNWAAYLWSVFALLPMAALATFDIARSSPISESEPGKEKLLFPNSVAVLVALATSLLYALDVYLNRWIRTRSAAVALSDVELTAWSVLSHICFALMVLSVLNSILILASRTTRPRVTKLTLVGVVAFALLQSAIARFFEQAFTFYGFAARSYSLLLAASLTLSVISMISPLGKKQTQKNHPLFSRGLRSGAVAIALALLAVLLPSIIGDRDFAGILQCTFTLLFWLAFSVCVYFVRPRRISYSFASILAVLVVSASAYKGAQFSAVVWAKALGQTDQEIAATWERYSSQDFSFGMVHHLVSGQRFEDCGALCRTMRDNTNIRNAEAKTDLRLVAALVPVSDHRPNIFIFVIDSLRADYVGAYNPRADFSPRLDEFARDSVVIRTAYTQYGGTFLSEASIWAGALLLHAHFMQPFSKVNSLQKLAQADGYQMVVSYDEVLRYLLSQQDQIVKLDTDKPNWHRLEVCSTTHQLENYLDTRPNRDQAIFFYAQPKNVHELAQNALPGPTPETWNRRPGFDNSFAYKMHQVDECLGAFFNYLKDRGLYNDSIIIVTADHGHATGEFGRIGHAGIIFPEVMRVPLIVHLPKAMQGIFVHDADRLSAVTDITPTLYYLLGHKPVRSNPLFGRPLFVNTTQELELYRRKELFMASDVCAVYGIISGDGRFFYIAHDSPQKSFLFDLKNDPAAGQNIVTDPLRNYYDRRIIENLRDVASFYGYTPKIDPLFVNLAGREDSD
jgi:hypothetical protein